VSFYYGIRTRRNVRGIRNSKCVRHVKDRYQIMDREMATGKLQRGKFSREVHAPPLILSFSHSFKRKCANSVTKSVLLFTLNHTDRLCVGHQHLRHAISTPLFKGVPTRKSERESEPHSCSTYCTSSRATRQIFAISAGKRAFPATMAVEEVPRLSRSASSVYQAMGNVTSHISLSFLTKEGERTRHRV